MPTNFKYIAKNFAWKNLQALPKQELENLYSEMLSDFTIYYCTPQRWLYRVSVVLGKRMAEKKSQAKYHPEKKSRKNFRRN